ncbi:hypothetical protein DFS33DRAFT_164012 [Desarmillaria ectypa]|nr:hypothetical protein DFS33DRAFT_164012 [Desarmillaria ectypa]
MTDTLRKRMHQLERAQSEMSKKSKDTDAGHHTEDTSLTELEYETGTESSEDLPQMSGKPPVSTKRSEQNGRTNRDLEDEASSNRAWYQFDLAVVAALVSPVGNLLTGGDLVKNLLYILFLLFYLHQLIEVPWSMYQNARPRRRSPQLPPDPSPDDIHKQNAHTELRRIEIFFLILATMSPFLGASFLRYILSLIAGEDILTWFSTGLFLLATGIRPWTHVVERLTLRISHLHDVIHYPSPEQTTEDLRQQLTDLKQQMEKVEHTLGKVRRRMDDGAEAMYEYVDEAVGVVGKNMRRHEKKCEKQDQRVKDVEISVESLRKVRGRYLDANANPSLLSYLLPTWLVPSPPRPSVKYPPPLSPSFSTASSTFAPSERLPTIPENGRLNLRKPAPEHPTGLGAKLFYGTVSLVTLPIRIAVAVVDRTV